MTSANASIAPPSWSEVVRPRHLQIRRCPCEDGGVIAPIPPWEPLSEPVLADQRGTYDRMRFECPLARSPRGVTLFRHADVVAAAADPATFSSAVSAYRMVPNSLDPPEHTAFRAAIDPFFTPERMGILEPHVRKIAHEIVGALPRGATVDAVTEIGYPLAVRAQADWLGWHGIEDELLAWMAENHAGTRSGDRSPDVRRGHRLRQARPGTGAAAAADGPCCSEGPYDRIARGCRRPRAVAGCRYRIDSSQLDGGRPRFHSGGIWCRRLFLATHPRCRRRFGHIPAIWLPGSTRCCGSTTRSSSVVA